MAAPTNPASSSAPEAACAREMIHSPGLIQPHGMLIAVDPTRGMALAAVSANIVTPSTPNPHHDTLTDLLGPEFGTDLTGQAGAGMLGIEAPWETTVTPPRPLGDVSGPVDVACHTHDGLVLIELEPAHSADPGHAMHATRGLHHAIGRLRAEQGGLGELSQSVARSIRHITGYERVLVYRFDSEWNGQAIAEDRVDDWHSLLGLSFPASDIPAQARALYHRSLIRWVASRDAEPVPLLFAPGWTTAIDLSHARLRSLSPVHMEYHRNLGVDGTMSISILVEDHLWGLVVCHHRQPHRTSAGQRAAAAALTDLIALRIVPAERAGTEARRRQEQHRVSLLTKYMAEADDLTIALTGGEVNVLNLFGASGAAVVQGRDINLMGATPRPAELRLLTEWLRETAPFGDVFATESLSTLVPHLAPDAATASGLLAVFLTHDRSDILLWFRPEEPSEVSWGGNPAKDPATPTTPRGSFKRWVETRHGAARSWEAWEIEIAVLLRQSIVEVIVRNLRRVTALNEQLRQSQKMEAVGQLTGGLAHDFNNLLGGITGSLELARTRLTQGRVTELDRYLAAAAGAALRAASLTHRLLAFSRRQTLDPKPTDVTRLIGSMEKVIRHTIGQSIQLKCITSTGLWTVLCDANQLENALLNLTINARDAMPDGGRLTVEATNVRLNDAYAAQFGVPSAYYVAVSVSDTGSGMSSETIARAFEPFFTTKPAGAGTGLGLSMVYGFAKQSGGHARIFSERGEGTTVRLYLPRHLGPAPDFPATTGADPARQGAATVLVVDDEPVLRMLVCEVLREQGLTILEASNGPQAMTILRSNQPLSLLITDVGLPGGMNGRQVTDAARQARPDLKVLFVTGYAENAVLEGGLLDPITQVMTKPFSMEALVTKVSAMLA